MLCIALTRTIRFIHKIDQCPLSYTQWTDEREVTHNLAHFLDISGPLQKTPEKDIAVHLFFIVADKCVIKIK